MNAVLDLSMPDWLSLPHVTALNKQIIISATGQFAERLWWKVIFSLTHQNDPLARPSEDMLSNQVHSVRAGAGEGSTCSQSVQHSDTKGVALSFLLVSFTGKALTSALTQASWRHEEMGPGRGMACWWRAWALEPESWPRPHVLTGCVTLNGVIDLYMLQFPYTRNGGTDSNWDTDSIYR